PGELLGDVHRDDRLHPGGCGVHVVPEEGRGRWFAGLDRDSGHHRFGQLRVRDPALVVVLVADSQFELHHGQVQLAGHVRWDRSGGISDDGDALPHAVRLLTRMYYPFPPGLKWPRSEEHTSELQ